MICCVAYFNRPALLSVLATYDFSGGVVIDDCYVIFKCSQRAFFRVYVTLALIARALFCHPLGCGLEEVSGLVVGVQ